MKRGNGAQTAQGFLGIKDLSLRSLVIGAVGAAIITASSMYVALRLSALPWPTIFVAVLSMSLLKAMGKTSLNEINVSQTAMSAGAMIAGGIAFTIPGLYIVGEWQVGGPFWPKFLTVLLISLAGMLFGTVLNYLLRPRFVSAETDAYPIGTAAAETLKAGDKGGKNAVVLFSSMGAAGLFALLRDSFKVIPQLATVFVSRNFSVGFLLNPMMASVGYLIGFVPMLVWTLGGVLGSVVLVPMGLAEGWFADFAAADSARSTIGIGLMVGTGVGIVISLIISFFTRRVKGGAQRHDVKNRKGRAAFIVGACAAGYVCTVAAGIGPLPAAIMLVTLFLTAVMGAKITGDSGVNPMEIFGVIALLIIRIFVDVPTMGAFIIAAVVAVACGYGADMLNDYKAGAILGTNPKAQLISQIVGGVIGVPIAAAAVLVLIEQYGGVGADFGIPAGQAHVVTSMVSGIENPALFYGAAAVGAVLYLLKVPSATLGLGVYLPLYMTLTAFVGALVRLLFDRKLKKFVTGGSVAASGVLGGEGIMGVILAIVAMVSRT